MQDSMRMVDQEVSRKQRGGGTSRRSSDAGPQFDISLGDSNDNLGVGVEKFEKKGNAWGGATGSQLIARLNEEVAGGRGSVGRKCRKKSLRKLAKKWEYLTTGLPLPEIRAAFIGGVVAEWKTESAVTLEFSRKLKRAWIDISSAQGDWGTEVRLGKKGWKLLKKKLRRILLD